ncbi:MAG TPA: Re/Si-specific NAD(P)(+) transhydrogenase subunit alpha [Capsulimonadaceae bacterium]|nr:Re/Si-specific NAD(P)(+) transhydrogenase subunit alpha [Capsulimonadaceae bacterium]
MVIGVPKEVRLGENRVALVPDAVARLVKSSLNVLVEAHAGNAASIADDAYQAAGAQIAPNAAALYQSADIVAKVARLTPEEIALVKPNTVVIAFFSPLGDPSYVQALAKAGITAMSMDTIPRITRAQAMDALSSQSNIAGYKAVLLAASALPRFFPMLTTAAGTVPPAKALILGAGVAGLQAIATARRLGAVVSAYDTRAAVKEQVQSLGAKFLEVDVGENAEGAGGYAKELSQEAISRQREFMQKHIGASDVVITTALVPGRKAPLLITEDAVRAMSPGSVIVDLAAEAGGNCELTEPDQVVVKHGITIIGTTNLPATVPLHASQLYARNISALLELLIKDGKLNLDMNDEIIAGTCLTNDGKVVHKPTLDALATAR